jgi:hypothetical protein
LARETGDAGGTRACIPNGKLSDSTTLTYRNLGAVQSTLDASGCGNVFFGDVLVAVRQGQRRYASATGEEQLGKCTARKSKYIRLICSVAS